jgi:ABC-type cobalamin/Fe3+-siderophores transport system ATPase subunit
MRLLFVRIIRADTCGGLLDGVEWRLRGEGVHEKFDPVCLIGSNGTGKSQMLQVLAEIFQSIFHAVMNAQERLEGNRNLQFHIEYLIWPDGSPDQCHVRATRISQGKRKAVINISRKNNDGTWIECAAADSETAKLLPAKSLATPPVTTKP